MTRQSKWFQKLFQPPGDMPGSVGGVDPGAAPAGSATPPPSGAPAPAAAAPAGTGAAPAAGADPNAGRPTFAYPEDRSKWIPPHRYAEVTTRVDTIQKALDNQMARTRALMGVAEPEDPRMKEVRDALRQVSPALAKIVDKPELLDRLEQFLEQDYPSMRGGTEAYAHRLAFETSTSAVEEYAKALGVDAKTLPEQRVNWMARQLGSFIAADPTGDRQARYDMRDPSIITELVSELTGFVVNPRAAAVGTTAAAAVARAQSLPQAGARGGLPPPAGTTERPKDKKSVHEAARQALIAGTNA